MLRPGGEGNAWESCSYKSNGQAHSEAYLVYQKHQNRFLRDMLPPAPKVRMPTPQTLPPPMTKGFHSSLPPPGFLPHSRHNAMWGEQPHPHSLTQPGFKFNFVLRIFIFPEQKQKRNRSIMLSVCLLCILLSGRQLHSGMQNPQPLT